MLISKLKKEEFSENSKINNLNIQQVKEGESYKYFGIDEIISFDGTTNKERVLSEYFKSP